MIAVATYTVVHSWEGFPITFELQSLAKKKSRKTMRNCASESSATLFPLDERAPPGPSHHFGAD
jgi:hypothetical protein